MSKPRPVVMEHAESPSIPDAPVNKRPLLRRADLVAFSLVALLTITIVAVLHLAKAFFLPIVMAFIVGTMLSPAAAFLQKRHIPRAISAVLIVAAACAGVTFIVSLITVPLMEWTGRLPEIGQILKDKMHLLDRPFALLAQANAMLGGSPTLENTPLSLPKIDWVQPTLGFISPTLAEFVLFVVTLILFIASWHDLRRAMVFSFAEHEWRLKTLRILNAIETNLGDYLLTVTIIHVAVGVCTGLICAMTSMPNPAGLGALATTLNFFPIIGPLAMFMILIVIGVISFPTLGAGLLAALAFAALIFVEGHFITPAIIGRRLALNALAVFMAVAFWTWLWGPMGGFLASPLLIIALVVKEHVWPAPAPHLPGE